MILYYGLSSTQESAFKKKTFHWLNIQSFVHSYLT